MGGQELKVKKSTSMHEGVFMKAGEHAKGRLQEQEKEEQAPTLHQFLIARLQQSLCYMESLVLRVTIPSRWSRLGIEIIMSRPSAEAPGYSTAVGYSRAPWGAPEVPAYPGVPQATLSTLVGFGATSKQPGDT